MNTEQLKQAALNGDPDAASPEQVLALLECVDALREWHEVHPNKDKKPGWVVREMNAQARCAAALQKLEAL